MACEHDRQDIVGALVENGMSIHGKALELAISCRHTSMIRLLFELGAKKKNLYVTWSEGGHHTIEQQIAYCRKLEMCEVLLEQVGDPWIVLFEATQLDRIDVIGLLVEDGFDINGTADTPDFSLDFLDGSDFTSRPIKGVNLMEKSVT